MAALLDFPFGATPGTLRVSITKTRWLTMSRHLAYEDADQLAGRVGDKKRSGRAPRMVGMTTTKSKGDLHPDDPRFRVTGVQPHDEVPGRPDLVRLEVTYTMEPAAGARKKQ